MNLEGKRIIITGGAGFLGSFVIERLKKRNPGQIFVPRSKDYDLTTEEGVRRLYEGTKPELVIHLAAVVGGIGANRENPGKFCYDNLVMGAFMVEYARRFDVEKLVCVGSICAYPKFTPVPFKEEHLWDGYPEETNAPYGLAKKMMLVLSQGYRAQYGLNSIFLLPVNLYGPQDNFDLFSSHVIPAIIRKCVEAKRQKTDFIQLWGTGKASREFLYVEDAARAITIAAECYEESDPVNIGAGYEITIKDLAQKIVTKTGFKGEIRWDASQPDGQPRRMLDTSRAQKEFGFQAETSLDDGLDRTIAWYEENF